MKMYEKIPHKLLLLKIKIIIGFADFFLQI